MKKILLVFLLLSLLAFPLFGGCTGPVEAETITVGFNHIWPATSFQQVDLFTGYFEMVEDAANGKYIIEPEFYPAGTLLGPGDIYDGVLKGSVDAGCSVVSYTPGLFPVMLTLSQSGIAPPVNADANSRTAWEFYNKFKPKEFEGVKVLYWFATPPAWLHSTSPITKLEDLKGEDVRATGASAKAITAIGGNPVSMPQPDVTISAQKGLVKASVAPFEVLMTYKQAEVFDYSTFIPFFYSEQFYMVMNLDKWNTLPKDLQKAFDSVADEAVSEAGQLWTYGDKRGMDYAQGEPGGHELIYLSDEEAARWIALLKPIRDAYVADLNAKGFPGEEIADEAGKIAEKYNKNTYEPWQP